MVARCDATPLLENLEESEQMAVYVEKQGAIRVFLVSKLSGVGCWLGATASAHDEGTTGGGGGGGGVGVGILASAENKQESGTRVDNLQRAGKSALGHGVSESNGSSDRPDFATRATANGGVGRTRKQNGWWR